MSYQKGEVKFDKIIDSRTEAYDYVTGYYLPHSCNEWVIGTKDDVRQLIEDLQAFISNHEETK